MKSPSSKRPAKNRLLDAAVSLFAAHGYEGASTRALAAKANVNISAIPYYFKDKEGLYRAVLDVIAEKVRAELAPKAAHTRACLKDKNLPVEECRRLAHDLVASFIRFLLDDSLSPAIARIFVREQVDPTPCFTQFYETTMRPMHETMTMLTARVAGIPFPSEKATLTAHALLGAITIFKTHQELALRRLGWKKYAPSEIAKITGTVLTHADAILNATRAKGRKEKRKCP